MPIALVGGVGLAVPAGGAAQGCCSLVAPSYAEAYRVAALADRRFTHAELWGALAPFIGTAGVDVQPVGESVQGRVIRAVTFGNGSTRVLLWSQMHGNESTATMALADIIRFFAEGGSDPLRRRIAERLTVTMIPMLNPDGAQRFQRHNAVGVDVNRDARRLATPEGRLLKRVRDSLQPEFGFNLHDQGARNTVGRGGHRVAISLLAPAAEETRAYGPVRARARQVAAALARGLRDPLPGRVSKYDDEFNPRAFGDLIQAWGTSTVLIESGVLPDDGEKQRLRAINVAAILTALDAIATGSFQEADPDVYESLPFNYGVANDLLLVGGNVVAPGVAPLPMDVALYYGDPVRMRDLRLGEVGDLGEAEAIDTVDVAGGFIHIVTPSTLDPASWWLIRGQPIAVVVRDGPQDESPLRFRLPQ